MIYIARIFTKMGLLTSILASKLHSSKLAKLALIFSITGTDIAIAVKKRNKAKEQPNGKG